MPTLSVKMSQEQESALVEVIDQNPGWDKTLITRALVNYFVNLNTEQQVDLVKQFQVKVPKNR